MKKSVEEKIKALSEKAGTLKADDARRIKAAHMRSSLHMVIRTKEQADRFMKQLQEA